MIGIVVTGHGDFADGIYKSFEMIAGHADNVSIVRFEDGMDLNEFHHQLNEVFTKYSNQYKGVLVLTDLLGGTPFNTSMVISQEFEKVRVLTGTNLSIVTSSQSLSAFSISSIANNTELNNNSSNSETKIVPSTSADKNIYSTKDSTKKSKVKKLPQSGSMIDQKTLIFTGILLIFAGLAYGYKKRMVLSNIKEK